MKSDRSIDPQELAIVIPCKNEEKYIGVLLDSLARQSYDLTKSRIVIADAGSTDQTLSVIDNFKDRFPSIKTDVIDGGLPAVGRNRGAEYSSSRYILFLDADIEIQDPHLIHRAVLAMRLDKLHCVTTDIKSRDAGALTATMYGFNNLAQHLSRLTKPFSTGMFMLFDRAAFENLGGFDEKVTYAEDYHLSMRVAASRFRVVPGQILASNRRFHRSGYLRVARLFLTTAIHSGSRKHFYTDHRYWQD